MTSLLSYRAGPCDQPLLHQTIGAYLQQVAERFPDRPAVVVRHQQIRWNYREYLIQIDRLALGLLALTAWFSARTTVYTLTDRRILMRIGIVLTLTFNLPLRKLAAAAIRPQAKGHGDIALTLTGGDRIAYLNLWPHARPWLLKQPQPSLRCVPDARQLGELVLQAWTAQNTDTLAILGTHEQGPAPARQPREREIAAATA